MQREDSKEHWHSLLIEKLFRWNCMMYIAFLAPNTLRGSLPWVHSQMFTPRGSLPEVHSQRFTPRGSGETLWWWNHFCQRNVFLGLELRARPVVTCKRGKVGGGDGGEWKEHGSYVLSFMMNEYVGDKKQWTTNYPTSFFTQILARQKHTMLWWGKIIVYNIQGTMSATNCFRL